MPNTLTLDSREFSEMVSQWEDGGKYYVTMEITQTSNDGTTFTATVDEVTDYGDSTAAEEEEMPMPAKRMPGKAMMKNAKSPTTAAY